LKQSKEIEEKNMLQEKIKEHQLTQKSLAELVGAGLDQPKVSRIINGEQKPTLLQALRFEELLGIPVRYWGNVANDNEPQNKDKSEAPK